MLPCIRAGNIQAVAMRVRLLWIGMLAVVVVWGGVAWWTGRRGPRLGQAALARTAAILAHGPRPPGSAGLQAVRGYLRAQLEASGWVTLGQAFERSTVVGTVKFENVRARFAAGAGDPWQRPVKGLLCAHVDSKRFKHETFLGADDSASACAAIVEIARLLATDRPAQAQQLELVFFDGEEALEADITPFDGLYGSRHYASEWRAGTVKPRFGVLLDMIGHKNLTIRLPSDTPEFLRAAVLAAADKEGAGQFFGMAAEPIIDDHMPLNGVGIPTLDIIGDFSNLPWWHTPSDNLQNISPESLDVSIRVTLRLLDGLLEGE